MFVATPYDKFSSRTVNNPAPIIYNRLLTLARGSLKALSHDVVMTTPHSEVVPDVKVRVTYVHCSYSPVLSLSLSLPSLSHSLSPSSPPPHTGDLPHPTQPLQCSDISQQAARVTSTSGHRSSICHQHITVTW